MDWFPLIATSLAGIIVGTFIRWPLDRISERRAFIRKVTEGYLEAAGLPGNQPDNQYRRLRTLQKLRAVQLSRLELREVCNQIKASGLPDPRDIPFPAFRGRKGRLHPTLRWARKHGIDLSDETAFMDARQRVVDVLLE